jgi:hypothetical protein
VDRTRVERVLVGVFAALPIAAIAVISLVRYGYLIEVGGDVGMGPVLGAFAFAVINLLVFGAAAGLSYLHHDPPTLASRKTAIRAAERERAERREAEQDKRRRGRELEARRERHEAELEARRRDESLRSERTASVMAAIRRGASERLLRLDELHAKVATAQAEVDEAQSAVDAIAVGRRALREATDGELAVIRTHRDRLVYAYCSANVRAREGHVTPACLLDMPPLVLPEGFRDPTVWAA